MNASTEILQPVVVLALWTFVMWFLMYGSRIPAISKLNLAMDNQVPPKDLMNQLPAKVRWKADNYNHLFELPTVFYGVALSLAVMGAGDGLNLTLAWAFVALRIVHSLFQAFINIILARFALFAISSLVLLALTVRAALAVF